MSRGHHEAQHLALEMDMNRRRAVGQREVEIRVSTLRYQPHELLLSIPTKEIDVVAAAVSSFLLSLLRGQISDISLQLRKTFSLYDPIVLVASVIPKH